MQHVGVVAVLWTALLATLSCGMEAGAEVPGQHETVRLRVRNPSGLVAKSWPMTTGVPFPRGTLAPQSPVALRDGDGQRIPVQTQVTSTWPQDGSVRWMLLDWQQPLDGGPEDACTLAWGTGVEGARSGTTVSVREIDADTYEVTTGPLVFEVRRDRFDFLHRAWRVERGDRVELFVPSPDAGPYFVSGEGETFRASLGAPDEVVIEEPGPLRAVVRANGWFTAASGEKRGQYVVRIHAFAGQPFVKVFYTFIVTEESHEARFRDIGLHLPMRGESVVFGADAPVQHRTDEREAAYLLQYDHDKFVVRRSGDRATWATT